MAAVASKFDGVLIGYDSYTKEGRTTHTYYVLIAQKQDKITGLYGACELVRIFADEPAIKDPKHGAKVAFLGEFIKTKNGGFMRYDGIEAVA